ncbi:class I SAM-dependent methyltransferase [Pseudoscardovia radai]|uniref:class I SAM-dependent methyltransferase n=1 Tax=Pseudoscardovia radai TaxID=987066 RepID=UPI003993FBF0
MFTVTTSMSTAPTAASPSHTSASAAPSLTPRLHGVSETMLQTLAMRGLYAGDMLAMSLLRRLDYDFTAAMRDDALAEAVVARTRALDTLATTFAALHPHGVVVNLAAGLDTRFHRIATADMRWFNVDLPDVVEARRLLLGHSRNLTDITADATSPEWARIVREAMDGAPSAQAATAIRQATSAAPSTPRPATGHRLNRVPVPPTLVLMEGLSMYLSDSSLAAIMSIVAEYFPGATFVSETITPEFIADADMPSIRATGSRFTWGAESGAQMERLEPRMRWHADIPLETRGHYLAVFAA